MLQIDRNSPKNITYGTEKLNVGDACLRNKSGRRRTLSTFQEFVMVMLRLRLGLFERDLAHRFGVHTSTVSRITRIINSQEGLLIIALSNLYCVISR